ncbi:IclR family transcriptional regulator [Microbacterium halotolerans]|uniref:IclR family transcriptional regulator n=1 Tax=Microbacterium halotolerans TaxID=246613 RepID=UPI0013C2F966|nr:IclR family transcriptional regulator [Microbacterium halotolerans]
MTDDPATPPPPDLIESVDHALRVLILLETNAELRVSDVAEQLGVARSTAHRLLATLAWRRFLVQDRVTRAFRAGTALIELGLRSVSEYDLRRAAEPHMDALAAELGETVNIIVLDEGDARFIGGVEGPGVVRTRVATGLVLPAYASSGGKVLLAALGQDEIRKLYPRGLKKVTAQTRKTFAMLREELAYVQLKGYAFNDEESAHGLRAMAVPVRDRIGRTIAALAISSPASRMPKSRVPALYAALTDTSTLIRNDLP